MILCYFILYIDAHSPHVLLFFIATITLCVVVAESLDSSQSCDIRPALESQDKPLSCTNSISHIDAYLKSDSELRELVAQATAPIIFSHVAHRIFGNKLWEWGPEKFRDQWGEENVSLVKRSPWVGMFGPELAHNTIVNMSTNISLAQMLHRTRMGNPPEELFINGHSHPVLLGRLRKKITLPPFDMAENERYSSLVLSVGSERAGLPMHYHGDSWLAQLYGTKRWWLLPPTANVSKLPPKIYHRLFFESAATWNNTEILQQRGIVPGEGKLHQACDVHVGQVIYIPEGWYHATTNINGPALAVGGQRFGRDMSVTDVLDEVSNLQNGSAHATSTAARKLMAIGEKRYYPQSLQLFVRSVRLHPLGFTSLFAAIKMAAELDEFELSCELLLLAMGSLDALMKEQYISDDEWASLVARVVLDWHLYTDPKNIFKMKTQWKLQGKKLPPSRWLLAVYRKVLDIIPKSYDAKFGHKVWHEQFSIS